MIAFHAKCTQITECLICIDKLQYFKRLFLIIGINGNTLDVTNIQNEVSNVNTTWDKYKYDMLTGASDPATATECLICIDKLQYFKRLFLIIGINGNSVHGTLNGLCCI